MLTAEEARQNSLDNGRRKAFEQCQKNTEDSILRAIRNGNNRTCLAYTVAYDKLSGKYIDCEDDIKTWLKGLGYQIKPTGYSGGVWQTTEDICW